MKDWISQNIPDGEPMAVLVDSRFIGWACGGRNAIRAHKFTKSSTVPRTLWPSWDDVSAGGWPVRGIWEPIPEFEVGLVDLTRGNLTGCGDDEAFD